MVCIQRFHGRTIKTWLGLALVLLSLNAEAKTIEIMTWNIRGDGRPFNIKDGRHGWEARKPLIKKRINHHRPAVIGIQEGYETQQKDLADYLSDYQLIFQHRGESGKEWHNSYYSSLLYKASDVEIEESFDAWLSTTPTVPGSQLPKSKYPRMVTGARLIYKPCSCDFWVFNTHLEHKNMDLNAQQMKILGEIVSQKLKGRNERVFLIGDFNRPPIGAPFELLKKQTSLEDSWLHLGLPEISTFNDYGKLDFFNDNSQRIDWILFSSDLKPQSITVDRYHQTRAGKEDVFPSDHFPVIGNFIFD